MLTSLVKSMASKYGEVCPAGRVFSMFQYAGMEGLYHFDVRALHYVEIYTEEYLYRGRFGTRSRSETCRSPLIAVMKVRSSLVCSVG